MDETRERSMHDANPVAETKPGNVALEALGEFWGKAKYVLLLIAAFAVLIVASFAVCAGMHYLGLDLLAQWLFREEYFIFGHHSIYELTSSFLGW